jgi:ubiquinone/menaquinone biosynthesis C-methylase UbiE
MELFDPAVTFDEDYLWFYEPTLSRERSRTEKDEIVELLRLTPGSSVLDAPCGHGRISNLLAAEGFEVVGVDVTHSFVERAKTDADQLGLAVDYLQGDLRKLPITGPVDAVICWFTSFGYFDDDDNGRVLAEFARVLKPGGKLLIETLHHDGFVRGFVGDPAAIVTERGDDSMTDVSTFDPITGRVETSRTVRRDGEVRRSNHAVRLPTVPELDSWLGNSGFVERTYSDRGGRPLALDSRRLVAIAVKGYSYTVPNVPVGDTPNVV